jgi:hypothetical protein
MPNVQTTIIPFSNRGIVMRKLVFILVPLIVFTFFGCSEDSSNPTTPTIQQDLMPLAVGNHWQFDAFLYNSGILVDTASAGITITGTIIDSTGTLCYLANDQTHYRNSNQGFHIGHEGYIFKYPASSGDQTSFGYPRITITVANTDTTVTTPVGEFRCIKYIHREQNSLKYELNFISPGIGPVRIESISPESGYRILLELRDYHLESEGTGVASRPNTVENRFRSSRSVYAGSNTNPLGLQFSAHKNWN